MLLTAKSSKSFLVRLSILTLCGIGFALYSLYDGAIAYPHQRVRALKYHDFKDKDQLDQWKTYAAEQGWSLDDPGKPKEELDFLIQFGMAGAIAPFGLLFLFLLIRASRRWIELSETGIRTSWGGQLTFDQIVTLNKKQWKTKGIARIYYDDNGRKRRVVLDDCKYDVETTKAILIEVEARLEDEQIVGGPPEAVEQPELEPQEKTNPQESTEESAE